MLLVYLTMFDQGAALAAFVGSVSSEQNLGPLALGLAGAAAVACILGQPRPRRPAR